jgi:TolA-binding protein
VRNAALLLAAAASVGCAHVQRAPANTIGDEWGFTLAEARVAADSGKYDAADNALSKFIATHNGTHEATEAIFWRGLFKVDPNNKNGSLSAGITSFDAYLASDSASWYTSEAKVLRRTAALAQSLKLAATVAQQTTSPTTPVTPDKDATKSRDEEIASLREQLAKVNAELERIKKRLANPKA